MDECSSGSDMPTASLLASRHRSPTFSKREVMSLINLIGKYKTIIFNKSTTTAVNHAKDKVWLKITKAFNSIGFEHNRSTDSLKTKFENLKREAKKMSKNLLQNDDEYDEATKHIANLMYNSENNANATEELHLDDDFNETEQYKETSTDSVVWKDNEDKYSDDSLDETNHKKRAINRSMNFSPDECNLLLRCVRQEKKKVLSDSKSSDAYRARDRAWARITNCFNKQSPRKRSTKVLRTKFCNMKRFAKNVQFKDIISSDKKHKKLLEETDHHIVKSEPMLDDEPDESSDEFDTQHPIAPMVNTLIDESGDPLSTVLNGDCKIDSMIPSENKDVVKLKLELLNYELETAKLQRRRVEMLIEAEAAERTSRALEAALRLRAARLSAVAAAAQLAPSHPALHIPPQEAPAQHYLAHYTHN